MRTPRRSTALILTGAVVLASGAYAIGTQAGGGSADARDGDSDARRFTFGPGERFADLADALGVDQDELRNALEDFGRQHMSERRDAFAAALAGALGKSTDEVQRALDSAPKRRQDGCVGPGRLGPGLRELASALDVTPAELRNALRQVFEDRGTDHPDGEGDLAEFLADRFNLSAAKVEQALDDALPSPPKRHFRGGPGPGFGPPGPPPLIPG
jgi:hypothetical protein